MTNPGNAVGTNAAYDGRTSVNAFNDSLAAYNKGVLSGWVCEPDTGLTVVLGGDGHTRDVAVAESPAGDKTSINNISGSPVPVTLASAPGTNSRIDAIVAYVDNPAQGDGGTADNPGACGLIAVAGTVASSPVAPNDSAIRTAITADGASGPTAYYVVLATVTVTSGTTDITSDDIIPGAKAKPATEAPVVLFSGHYNGNITLSDDAANYKRIKIYYSNNDGVHNCVEVFEPDGKRVDLTSMFNTSSSCYIKTETALISGNTIEQVEGSPVHDVTLSSGNVSVMANLVVYYDRVEGWKAPEDTTLAPEPTYNDDYSLSEIDTGTRWIDGKTIYKKTINFGALPNATEKTVAHGIVGLDAVVKIEGITVRSDNFDPIPLVFRSQDAQHNTETFVNSTSVGMINNADQSARTAYITIYYTKS